MKLKKITILSAVLLTFSATGLADILTNQQVKELVTVASKGNQVDLKRLTSNAKGNCSPPQCFMHRFDVKCREISIQ